MGYRRTLGAALLGSLAAGALLWVGGCALSPLNSFLDQTKVGQFPLEPSETGIRRVLSPRETPPGLASAIDPTPEDLVPVFEEYRIVAGDILGISIPDLLGGGVPYSVNVEVNPLGEIRIPDLGAVRVTGLTEQELENELASRLEEANLLARPLVIATIQQKRGRIYHMLGGVRAPGPYAIGDPELRLLDALGQAGDTDPSLRRAYIIRRESGSAASVPARKPAEAAPERGWIIEPPHEPEPPMRPASLSSVSGLGRSHPQEAQEEPPPPTREELEDVLKPQDTQPRPAARPQEAPFPPIIFDPQTGQVLPQPVEPPPPAPNGQDELKRPFDWENVEDIALSQRVIDINLEELKAGDPRQNVVIRDRDVINIPVDTGLFYMMGEVLRPGVYAFGGRDITVKQALAITGGLSPLAWPMRCELIRREPGTDKQITRVVNLDAIFAGLEDDFYLRDDDILNVGTHFVAPFLFVIRNSFRFTYGFGFVYDRNFADIDAFSNKINPQIIEQQNRQSRGLPF